MKAELSSQPEYLAQLRHTCEHVLTQAMHRLYGADHIIMAMGPATDDGFYFDFEVAVDDQDQPVVKISEEIFADIEKVMAEIIKQDLAITRQEIELAQARQLFSGNPYKQEWLDEIEAKGEKATVYWTGTVDESSRQKGESFVDLCKGPHVDKTGEIKAFKLLSVAGAYWRGDEKNKMLTRIYGTAFTSQKELDEFLAKYEQAKLRDHRRLGRELDLFTFSPLVGSGLPLYTQKGALLRRLLNQYVEELQAKEGYQQVWTPQMARAELFKTSGHYDKYKDDMFRVVSNYTDDEIFLKPMNCPQHTQIYLSKPRSYRELPIRMTDFAMLYRDERPGELNGLARVRSFSQDDCHIFCREDQVDEEIDTALAMTKQVMQTFGFSYRYRLSTRDPQHPEKYLGDPKVWDKVEAWAVKIMQRNKIDYYDGVGEAAFYAPKMDLMATDALGREWQLSTIQIDFVMPERFNLTYTASDGSDQHPVMIHRAILGSAERLLMVLLEHYAGKFPLWLAPVQAVVLPITSEQTEYCQIVMQQLRQAGLRVELDDRPERMQAKIRDAQLQKIPYMLVVGKREEEAQSVAIRHRDRGDEGVMALTVAVDKLKTENDQR